MAVGDYRLTTTRYVRPGVYIGYVRQPRPITAAENPRYPCYVGKGHRLAQARNAQLRRAYVTNEKLTFSTVVPYTAMLQHVAMNDKLEAILYKINRDLVPYDKWEFRESISGSGVYDSVEIIATEFDKKAEYYIDYQSLDRSMLDTLPFENLRQMISVGDSESQNMYAEYIDYRIVTELVGNTGASPTDPEGLVPANTNQYLTGAVSAIAHSGTGSPAAVSFSTASAYTYKYSADYELYVRNIVGNDVTFEIRITPTSGGNDQHNKVPFNSNLNYLASPTQVVTFTRTLAAPEVGYNLSLSYDFDDGILLDFAAILPGPAYVIGDSYVWSAFGPGRMEFHNAHHNDNQFAQVNDPAFQGNINTSPAFTDASSGTLAVNAATDYTDEFNRKYYFRVYDAGGPPTGSGPTGNRQFSIMWSGYEEIPYTQGVLQVDETDVATYQQVELEKGIYLDVNLGAGHYNPYVGAGELITAPDAVDLTTAVTLAANIKLQHNTHDASAAPIPVVPGPTRHKTGPATHLITLTASDVPTLIAFCVQAQSVYAAHISDSVMHTPADTIWTLDDITVSDLATAVQCLNDLKEKANRHIKAHNFIEGDQWTMSVLAPRRDFTAKDDRNYTLTVGTVVDGTSMTVAWYTDTFEGGFDSWTLAPTAGNDIEILTVEDIVVPVGLTYTLAHPNVTMVSVFDQTLGAWINPIVPPPGPLQYSVDPATGILTFNAAQTGDTMRVLYRYVSWGVSHVSMPDTVSLAVRNFPKMGAGERYAAGDKFTFSGVDSDEIDWNLRARTSETIANDEIFQDVLGRVTGIPLSWYVILSETPEEVLRVYDASTDALLSYTQVMTSNNEPTNYIMFVTKPANDVVVVYEHRGAEPSPGQFYYVTANRLRADSEYEVPIRYLTKDDMELGLAPKTTDNHLWLGGDIAFDTAFFGAYFCQVKDISGNQVYSTSDFRRAIDATEKVMAITDLIVLGFFPAVPYAKLSIEKMADPFKRSERMLWVGTPIGTIVGDVDTPNTLVYLAKKTLQFQGDNPGRGHVVLLGNPRVTRTVTLDDGTTARVELDGSFLAGYAAARNAEFVSPSDTLLRKDTASFDDMDIFNEAEQDQLGSASITWLNQVGTGMFRFEESFTVDTSAPDLQEISAMNQKIYVTRKVSRDMDNALISIVPPSPAAGVALVQAYLTDELSSIASSGVVAPYGSETNPPTIRMVGPQDMYVFVDELDRRLYHIGYFFNIRYPIKKIFGLYSVDTRFWDART